MGLYKRNATWWGQFRGQRFSTGIPVTPEPKTMRVRAEEVYNTRCGEILDGQVGRTRTQQHTLKDMLDRWMTDHGARLKSAPILRVYTATLLAHFGPTIKLASITSDRVEQYKHERGRSVGPAAINRELATLRAAFYFAIKKWKWYSRTNPVWEAGLCGGETERVRWLTPDEYRRLQMAAPAWFWDICQFVIATGLRREELVRVTWTDVDLQQRTLAIPVSKTGKPAVIPLLDPAMEVLARQVRSVTTSAVFYDSQHQPYKPDYLTRQMARWTRQAGIPDFKLHDLRHTCATYLVQAGVDLYTIQQLLRHSDGSMTARYAHHDTESVRAGLQGHIRTRSSQTGS